MNIIRFQGGLGNQLFQYALYEAFLHNGVECKADLSYYDQVKAHNGYELSRLFDIDLPLADNKECAERAFYKIDKLSRLLIRLIHRPRFYSNIYTHEVGYDSSVLGLNDYYIEGYFQSERYFKDIELDIRNALKPRIEITPNAAEYMSIIKECECATSLHIRRGDYSTMRKSMLCDTAYYDDAIEYVIERHENATFFVFSNDLNWCKERFKHIKNVVYVDGNSGEDSYWDMYLMSQCNHNIIADSSFSWWGAWLNENANKIVIAPKKWLPGIKITDILPDEWIQIEDGR